MDYSIALRNGMNPSTHLYACEINVRFCFAWYIKAVTYCRICFSLLDVSEMLVSGVSSMYNLIIHYLNSFVMLRKLTSASLSSLFTNKIDVFPFYKSGFYLPTGGGGEASLQMSQLPPKVFLKKKLKLKLFQIKMFFDDDFKESVKVTNVQKCDFC